MKVNILRNIEKECKAAAHSIDWNIEYIELGEREEDDVYCVSFKPLGVIVYGKSIKDATESAIMDAEAKLMTNTPARKDLLRMAKNKPQTRRKEEA